MYIVSEKVVTIYTPQMAYPLFKQKHIDDSTTLLVNNTIKSYKINIKWLHHFQFQPKSIKNPVSIHDFSR